MAVPLRNPLLALNGGVPTPNPGQFVELNAEFTDAAQAFDPRITFTRSTIANRFNSSGTLTSTAIDVPRANANQDYNPSTLAARGFLIEAGATNLCLQSQTFDNATWVKSNGAITANAATAPDATTTADNFVPSAGTADHVLNQDLLNSDLSVTRVFSVYLRANGITAYTLYLRNAAQSIGIQANIDLSAVTATANNYGSPTSALTPTIAALPNGWYRVTLGGALSATTETLKIGLIRNYSADGTSGILVWGAQLEASAFATSYIATTTAATARGADNASILSLPSIGYSQVQGTLNVEFMLAGMGASTNNRLLYLTDGTVNNVINLLVRDGVDDKPLFAVTAGGALQYADSPNVVVSANTVYKFAASWSASEAVCSCNGVGASAGAVTVPSVTELRIGRDITGNHTNGWIRRFSYIPQKLSQSQLNAMTA